MRYLLLLLMILCSCSSSYNLWKLEKKNPKLIAEFCAERYPVIVPDPIYKEGEKIIAIDTIYAECDSVAKVILIENPGISEAEFLALLKKHSVTNNNWSKVDTIWQSYTDSAKVYALQLEKEKSTSESIKYKSQRNVMYWILGITGILLIVLMYFVLRIKKLL